MENFNIHMEKGTTFERAAQFHNMLHNNGKLHAIHVIKNDDNGYEFAIVHTFYKTEWDLITSLSVAVNYNEYSEFDDASLFHDDVKERVKNFIKTSEYKNNLIEFAHMCQEDHSSMVEQSNFQVYRAIYEARKGKTEWLKGRR